LIRQQAKEARKTMLDIHALRVFLEAARTENFTEAARLLNLTQPAVSMQVRSLENYLQVDLFERDGRNVRLTKSGQALVPLAQQVVQMALAAEESIRASDGKVVGNLVIGCSTASGKYILPHIVARFQRLYPEVRVSIPIAKRREVIEGVQSGEYDISVASLRGPETDVTYIPFFTDRLVLIAPVTHPWVRRMPIHVTDLLSERFICREPESACRIVVNNGLAQMGLDLDRLDIVMEVGNPEALAMAVEHGIGVSFVSLLAAAPRLALDRLSIIQVSGLSLTNPVDLIVSNSRPASLVRSAFIEFINQPQTRSQINALAEGRIV
jgi:DNA-binding transcriptional LysR family regulator